MVESRFPSARASSAGVYLLDHWEIKDRFFVTAGVRADRHSRAGTAMTFRVAPAYFIAATGTRLKATLGTGFKSPSLYQLFAPATSFGPVGNPLLRPERAVGWDAGIEQRLATGRIVLGLSWFENSFATSSISIPLPAISISAGLKLRVSRSRRKRGRGRRLSASYAWLSARDTDSGTALLRRPRDKFSVEAGLRLFGRFDLAAHALWVGRRFDRDFGAFPYQMIALPGYTLLDAVVTAALGPQLEPFCASTISSTPATRPSGDTGRRGSPPGPASAWPFDLLPRSRSTAPSRSAALLRVAPKTLPAGGEGAISEPSRRDGPPN